MGGEEGVEGESAVKGVDASVYPVLVMKGTGGDDM